MRKQIQSLIISVLTFVVLFSPIIAQAETVDIETPEVQEISDPALKLSFKRGTQTYPDKSFTVLLHIESDVTSGRVSVIWSYPRGYLTIDGEAEQNVTLKSGETTTITRTFTPNPGVEDLFPGKNKNVEIGARVNAFVANQNYLSSSSVKLTMTDELVFIPADPDYQTKRIVSTTLYWVVGIVGFILINFLIITGVKKFKAYLNSDDEK